MLTIMFIVDAEMLIFVNMVEGVDCTLAYWIALLGLILITWFVFYLCQVCMLASCLGA